MNNIFLGLPNQKICEWIKSHKPGPVPPEPDKKLKFKTINGNIYEFEPSSLNNSIQYVNSSGSVLSPYKNYPELSVRNNLKEVIDETESISVLANYAFRKCQSITDVSFPSVKNIGTHAFQSCYSLSSVDISSVVDIKDSFVQCSNLISIDIRGVSSITGSCFDSCTNLKQVIMDSVISVNNYAFINCSSLSILNLPSAEYVGTGSFRNSGTQIINIPKIKNISNLAFYNCKSISVMNMSDVVVVPTINSNSVEKRPWLISAYVPNDLVESFKTATNWSSMYSNNIVKFIGV